MAESALRTLARRNILSHSVLKYGAASILPRGLGVAGALILMPLIIDRVGVEGYAIWLLATQIPTLVVSPDLGMGQAIINEMAATHRREGHLRSETRKLYGLLKIMCVVSLSWLLVGTAAAVFFTMSVVPSHERTATLLALTTGLLCFLTGVPATLWQRVQLAQEQGHVGLLWEGLGKGLAIVASLLVLVLAPSLLVLIVAFLLPPTLALWGNGLWYIRRNLAAKAPPETPKVADAFKEGWRTMGRGQLFVAMQVGYLISTALDPYFVGGFTSTHEVTRWSVTRRPFEILPLVVALYSTALWPLFARLDAARRQRDVRRLLWALGVSATATILVAGFLITVFQKPIYHYLGSGEVDIRTENLPWFTLLAVGSTLSLLCSTYLNAMGELRTQAAIFTLGAVALAITKVGALRAAGLDTFIAANSLGFIAFLGAPILALTIITQRRRQRESVTRDRHAAIPYE